MFKLDNDFLTSLGLGGLPVDEKNKLLQMIYERLEMNVGMRLAEKMTDQQLDEFESFIDQNDEAGALKWLETNFPNYKDVVAEELEKLRNEVTQVAPQILAAQGGAAPEPAIMHDPLMPGVPQPMQMPASSPVQQQPSYAPQPAPQTPLYDQPMQHMQPPAPTPMQQPQGFTTQQPAPMSQPTPQFAPAQPAQPTITPYDMPTFGAPVDPEPSQPVEQPAAHTIEPAYPLDQPAAQPAQAPTQDFSAPAPVMQPAPGFMPPAPGFAQPHQPVQPQQFTPPPSFTPGQ